MCWHSADTANGHGASGYAIRGPTPCSSSSSSRPGEAIVSSGDYERYYEHDGERYHHVLDPASGRPASAAGTTIIADDPELADAAATALMVAGPSRFTDLATRMGAETALLVDSEGRVA